jgi:hypothetical protein
MRKTKKEKEKIPFVAEMKNCGFRQCEACGVVAASVERFPSTAGGPLWLCHGCRVLEAMAAVGPMSLGVIDPIYDPVTDAPLELGRGIEKELQQAMEGSLKFDGDVVSRDDHDKAVIELQMEVARLTMIAANMVTGHVRNFYGYSAAVTVPKILDEIPHGAIKVVRTSLPSAGPANESYLVSVEIDPAVDPRVEKRDVVKTSLNGSSLKDAEAAFDAVFFNLKTIVDERAKRVSLVEKTEPLF